MWIWLPLYLSRWDVDLVAPHLSRWVYVDLVAPLLEQVGCGFGCPSPEQVGVM